MSDPDLFPPSPPPEPDASVPPAHVRARRRRWPWIVGGVAALVVIVGGAVTATAMVLGDDGPNDATRRGCRILADAVVQMNPSGANRAQVRGLIGDAMAEFRDSNDDVIHEAASNVELSYTTLDDSLFSTSMRAIDSRCRHHYVLGWDE